MRLCASMCVRVYVCVRATVGKQVRKFAGLMYR